MTELTLADSKLKELLKVALTEVLQEQRELFAEVMMEALEDVALAQAIRQGEKTDLVSRTLITMAAKLSEPVLQKVWDNPADADYDNL